MKKTTSNVTELVFVLDRSGSMESLTSETIGGFNSLIEKQKKDDAGDEVYVTTVLFDDQYEILHDHISISEVNRMTDHEYYARGCTALLDAVGQTIKTIDKRIESDETKVLFVITTDGYENASREYTKAKIKKMISKRQDKNNWKFLFLGANIDAVSEADSIGIRPTGACQPSASVAGVRSSFDAINGITQFMRKSAAPCASAKFAESFEEHCRANFSAIE